jgi:hypothetical protein
MLLGAPPCIKLTPIDLYLIVSYDDGLGEIISLPIDENLLTFKNAAEVL